MTVQELIEKLKTLPQDSQVVMDYTDPTDWHYVTPLSIEDISFEEQLWTDNEDDWDDDLDDDKAPFENVVVITFTE